MGFKPVASGAGGYLKGYKSVVSAGHYAGHQVGELRQLVRDNIEYQFVMYLQYHGGAKTAPLHFIADSYHGEFDDIGCRALQRRIYGISFGISAHYGIAAVDVRQDALTPHACGDVALCAGLFYALLHILLYARIGIEVVGDQFLCFRAWNAEALRQSECRYAVDDAEIGVFAARR